MKFDLNRISLTDAAFDDRPMSFIKPELKGLIGDFYSIGAIESAPPRAVRRWQDAQMRHLFSFASQRSSFWRQRLMAALADKKTGLANVPVLTREVLREQVNKEGSLLTAADKMPVTRDQTSGSSGTPLAFYVSQFNEHYSTTHTIYHALRSGRDLSANLTQFKTSASALPNGFRVDQGDSWLGPLSPFAKSGAVRVIRYSRPDIKLIKKEILKAPIGYMVSVPGTVRMLFQDGDPSFLRRAGAKMWIPIGAAPDEEQRSFFKELDIPIQAHYSSRETGAMGIECETHPGYYHVNNSNVIVEIGKHGRKKLGRDEVGPVLVTRLHSYATPIMRYENGDVATLHSRCPCGHDGPTLSNIHGRQKNLIAHRDGSISTFFVQVKDNPWLLNFDEYRFRQTGLTTMKVEVGGREKVSPEEQDQFAQLVRNVAGPEFEIEIEAFPRLEWGSDEKRLAFRNDVIASLS